MDSNELRSELLEANQRIDQVEVLLRNLLCLRNLEEDRFTIPHLDLVVTLQTAVNLLSK